MTKRQDKVTRDINAALNKAWPAIKAILKPKRAKKPSGSLDERERRRRKMLRDNTPLPGQLSLFDERDT